MPKVDFVSWGKVTVDGQPYHQALIVGDKVIERDKTKLESLFKTTHEIGEWEREKLLSGNPEIILVASGWSGILEVDKKFADKITRKGIALQVILTPKAVAEYNRLVGMGKRVNALIHTTC